MSNFRIYQRKRKLDELSKQIESTEQKRKATEELIGRAKIGREVSVSIHSLMYLYFRVYN